MNTIEIIRAEIERLHEEHISREYRDEAALVLKELEDFLETLPEQPASEDLDAELKRMVYDAVYDLDGPAIIGTSKYLSVEDVANIARHFYDLGCRHVAVLYDDIEFERQRRAEEAEISEDLEEEIKRWIHAQRNNGRKLFGWIDMVELAARHFAEWGAEHLKR